MSILDVDHLVMGRIFTRETRNSNHKNLLLPAFRFACLYSPDVAILCFTSTAAVVSGRALLKDVDTAPLSCENSAEVNAYLLISSAVVCESKTGGVCGDSNRPAPTNELSTQHFLLLISSSSSRWENEQTINLVNNVGAAFWR